LPLPLHGPLLPIFLVIVVDILGLTLIWPLLPFYAEHLGASPTQVGLLVSTYAGCQLVAGPILGRLSDVYGRRRLLLVSQAGTLIGFLILGYAQSLTIIFLSRVIDGITAGNISLAQAYIADVTQPEERARSFAIIGIAFGLGFLVGPGVSGFLSQFGYIWPIAAASLLSATSIAATWFLLPETRTHERAEGHRDLAMWRHYRGYFRHPVLGTLLWELFLYLFAFSMFMSGFALFAERRFTWQDRPFGPKEVGYVFAYIGLLGIFWQGMLGQLLKRMRESSLVRWGLLVGGVGLAILSTVHDVASLIAASTVISAGSAVVRPALTSLITQQTGKAEQGTVLGLTQALMSIAQIFGPFLAGVLIDKRMLASWALAAAGFMLAAWALSLGQPVNSSRAAVSPVTNLRQRS
jgi:MFS family permease